jgi:hypothetical protein
VVKDPSRLFNPTIPESVIDAALERDPEAASAEWLAEWREDLSDYINRAVVAAAVIAGRHELPLADVWHSYHAFVDPSGGSADSFTLAIAHGEQDRVVLDLVQEIKPPFSPADAVAEFAVVLRQYGLRECAGDRYGGQWVAERFKDVGIDYVPSERAKSQIYTEFLPLLNSGKVELLDNARLISQ